jgi:large subunit ribosomal protein L18
MQKDQKLKMKRRLRRRNHVRRRVRGTAERPRLTVFRSSKHIYAQLIDDLAGVTLAAASSNDPDLRAATPYGGNVKAAAAVGKKLAEVAKAKGITKAAFDRGHYRFHGRVKALAWAAATAGLECSKPQAPEPKPEKGPPKAEKAPPKAEKGAKGEKGEKAPKGEKKEKKEK